MRVAFIGAPASGKGTQAELLAKKLNLPLISSGNLFRWHIKEKTELGKQVEEIIKRGELVSDEITSKIVAEEIKKQSTGFILDGFPRNLNQANFLETITRIDVVFEIFISDDEVMKRLSGRRVCKCGMTYHLLFASPQKDEICDKCGGKLFIREDDKPESVLKRIKIYHQQTEPLINFYQNKGNLIKINGEQPIADVFKDINTAIPIY